MDPEETDLEDETQYSSQLSQARQMAVQAGKKQTGRIAKKAVIRAGAMALKMITKMVIQSLIWIASIIIAWTGWWGLIILLVVIVWMVLFGSGSGFDQAQNTQATGP